jgi:hypothetical protein
MTMLHDALADLKNIALSGKPLPFAEVAADYDINPKLLERKWHESYPNGVVAPLMTEKQMIEKKTLETIIKLCQMYGVNPGSCPVREVRGVKYTIIGRLAGAKRFHFAAVSHKDGRSYKLASL